PKDSGTEIAWSADADIQGVVSGIGGNMLKSQSEKMVSQIFANIKRKLEEP
ncbi:MAG: carbon monoxide dehydrogenase, partial [Nitrososphaerota archaeon]|nr:carbon monoxide dehydrogenase [Nitrososphaerota archaeon]